MRNLMGRRVIAGLAGALALVVCGSSATSAGAQDVKRTGAQNGAQPSVFAPAAPATYTEKFEIYGGLLFMNGMAGEHLTERYNMGGGEGMLTWYVTPKWGAVGDFRWAGGTTPMLATGQAAGVQTRPFVSQTIGMGGVQYRWLHNRHAALQLHALGGVSHGTFSHSLHVAPVSGIDTLTATGLYSDRSTGMGVVGASIDVNKSARWAVRLQPEMLFEHFGTNTREFFSISGGVLYRFGKR